MSLIYACFFFDDFIIQRKEYLLTKCKTPTSAARHSNVNVYSDNDAAALLRGTMSEVHALLNREIAVSNDSNALPQFFVLRYVTPLVLLEVIKYQHERLHSFVIEIDFEQIKKAVLTNY